MITSSSSFTTLGSVRRVTAFFALLLLSLGITSCGPKKSHESLMKEQAGLYQEMSSVLQGMADEGDVEAGAKRLTELVSAFQSNRADTAALPKISEEEQLRLSQLPDLAAGHKAFFEAQSAFFSSKNSSTKIADILSGLHESKPVAGEGRSQ